VLGGKEGRSGGKEGFGFFLPTKMVAFRRVVSDIGGCCVVGRYWGRYDIYSGRKDLGGMGEWVVIVWLVVGSSGLCFMDNKEGVMECMMETQYLYLFVCLSSYETPCPKLPPLN